MDEEEIQRGTAITTAEYNKLKAKADRLDELLVIYKRHYGNVIEYAIELQEKAEKWDKMAHIMHKGPGWQIDTIKADGWDKILRAWNKLEVVKTHLESYPDEKDDEKYSIERHYPSTAGPRIFNSVLFLTHLETWHKQLKEILECAV